MNLRQFNNVIAVIENGSVGKAAKALHIAQPALTKSIKRLEQELGVPLFHRNAHGMQPTVFGECLRSHAQAITVGVSQALIDINSLKSGANGELNIAAPPTLATDVLADALARLSAKRPGLRTRVFTSTSDSIPGLCAGDYHMAINLISRSTLPEGLEHELLFEDRLVVIARRGHPITRRSRIFIRDLEPYRWVLPVPGNVHRRRLESMFEAEQLPPPRPTIECNSIPFIERLIARSDHLGVVTKVAAQTSKEKLSVIDFESPSMVRPIGLIWRAKPRLSEAARMLIAEIKGQCENRKPMPRTRSRLYATLK